MQTLLEILNKSKDFLAQKGVPNPRVDAEYLVAHGLGLKRRLDVYLQFERPLMESELEAIRSALRRRAKREPLQHILGEWPFDGLVLRTDARALVPRPETEEFVDRLAALFPSHPARVLDLGTGTGALALALAHRWPAAEVVATDVSADALALAAENAARNDLAARVRFIRSDWWSAVPDGPFDLIVSNPPYLSDAEVAEAAPEVRDFEPHLALSCANEGFAAIATILSGAPARLAPGGLLALETGIAQKTRLEAAAATAGFARWETWKDFHDRDRHFLAWSHPAP